MGRPVSERVWRELGFGPWWVEVIVWGTIWLLWVTR